jgi:hypothetical protein
MSNVWPCDRSRVQPLRQGTRITPEPRSWKRQLHLDGLSVKVPSNRAESQLMSLSSTISRDNGEGFTDSPSLGRMSPTRRCGLRCNLCGSGRGAAHSKCTNSGPRFIGVSPAVARAARSHQDCAGRMPTPQRARRPRYVQGISAFTSCPHFSPRRCEPAFRSAATRRHFCSPRLVAANDPPLTSQR